MKLNQIFENLDREQATGNVLSNVLSFGGTGTSQSFGTISNANGQSVMWNSDTKKVNIIRRIKFFGIKIRERVQEVQPDVFFETIKRSKKQIKIIDNIVGKYIKSIERAHKFGQTALVEKLKEEVEVVKKEALACAEGVNEYITEKQVETLMRRSTKNIEIDNIENFVRHLPEDLLEKVENLKKSKVFDMYVVMHYDPKKENTELTKKEKERKKDPILFGLIKGSRNLYFIGDWVDPYCDLTLKEVVSIMGEKTKKVDEK